MTSTSIYAMAEAILQRHPSVNDPSYTWEESSRLLMLKAETEAEVKDSFELLCLAHMWHEKEN